MNEVMKENRVSSGSSPAFFAPVFFPLFVDDCLPLSLVGHYVIDLPVLEAFLFSYFQKPTRTISGCRSSRTIVEPSLNTLIQGEFIFNM